MTLFEAQPYDPERARRRRRRIVLISVVVQDQNFEKAYGIWMNDPDWKQHPDKYARYPLSDFIKDWGPGGEWGIIKSHSIDGTAVPKGGNAGAFVSPSGIVVVVTVNERIGDKAHIWVEKSDRTLSFSPY